MGFRFKKVIKIAPGIKLNVSKSGISTSIGPKGATMNVGRHGVRGTVGIPGSGLSYSQQLVNKHGKPSSAITGSRGGNGQQTLPLPTPAGIELDANNKAIFVNEYQQGYESSIQTKLRKMYAGEVQDFLNTKVEAINEITSKIENIKSYYKPSKCFYEPYHIQSFLEQEPNYNQILNRLKEGNRGLLSLFNQNQVKQDADEQYQQRMREYNQRKQDWIAQQNELKQFSNQILQLKERASRGDINSMEQFLEKLLIHLDSPIHFSGSFDVECAEGIWLDIDLPEIEEIPDSIASVNASNGISIKKKSKKKVNEDYSDLVSGIVLILASNVFSLLPSVDTIVVSGYTQRLNKTNGHIEDDYIYSVIVEKSMFNTINLQYVSPLGALDNFNSVKNVTKAMEWKTITPYYKG